MSDGLSESRREEAAAKEIDLRAAQLANAFDEVRDAAFGYTNGALQIANGQLALVGLEIVEKP